MRTTDTTDTTDTTENPDIFYHADLEGNYKTLMNSLKAFFNTDEANLNKCIATFVDAGGIFIFGGNYPDARAGRDETKLLKALVWLHENYPDNVKFILGNRDINKLRFSVEDPQDILADEIAVLETRASTRVASEEKAPAVNKNSSRFIDFLANYFKIAVTNHQATTKRFDGCILREQRALYYQWTLATSMDAADTWQSMLDNEKKSRQSSRSTEVELDPETTQLFLREQHDCYTEILINLLYIVEHGQFHYDGLDFSAQHGAIGPKFEASLTSLRDRLVEKNLIGGLQSNFFEAEAVTALFKVHFASVKSGEIRRLKKAARNGKLSPSDRKKVDLYNQFQDFALSTRGSEFIMQHPWSQVKATEIKRGTVAYRKLFEEEDILLTSHTPHGDTPCAQRMITADSEGNLKISCMIVRASTYHSAAGNFSYVKKTNGKWEIRGKHQGGEFRYELNPANVMQGISFNPDAYSKRVKEQFVDFFKRNPGLEGLRGLTYAGRNEVTKTYDFFIQKEPEEDFAFVHQTVSAREMTNKIEPFIKLLLTKPEYEEKDEMNIAAPPLLGNVITKPELKGTSYSSARSSSRILPNSRPKSTTHVSCGSVSLLATSSALTLGAVGFGIWATLTSAAIGEAAIGAGLTVLTGIVWPIAIVAGIVALSTMLYMSGCFDGLRHCLFGPTGLERVKADFDTVASTSSLGARNIASVTETTEDSDSEFGGGVSAFQQA